jgi:hypothetical protein
MEPKRGIGFPHLLDRYLSKTILEMQEKIAHNPMFGNIVAHNTKSKYLLQLIPTFGVVTCI